MNYGFEVQPFYNLEEVDIDAGEGVFFYGLYMESGRIDEETLLLEDALPS